MQVPEGRADWAGPGCAGLPLAGLGSSEDDQTVGKSACWSDSQPGLEAFTG